MKTNNNNVQQLMLLIDGLAVNDVDTQKKAADQMLVPNSAIWKEAGICEMAVDKAVDLLGKEEYTKAHALLKQEAAKGMKRKQAMKKKTTTKKSSTKKTPAKTKKAATKTPKAAKKAPTKAKKTVEKTLFGHRVGSSAAFMDKMIIKGVTPTAAAKAINEKFGNDEAKAKAKFLVHVRYLKNEKKITMVKFKGDSDKVKAKIEKA